ncbi:MAG TPA: DUF5666 domain-containing protein [Bryobacteraceae bacterium]|jgi:Cu/Ag efflux protein CusF|nr:DUF5666 domain-containing protein [Bryobacteraceae bacterium]
MLTSRLLSCLAASLLLCSALQAHLAVSAQEPTTAAAKPTEHVIGTISAIDPAAQTITVKEDKTNQDHVILLAATHTLLKVPPGAKDLKTATRITASDLSVGDRVDVRGNKPADAPDKIAARSVVLMSGRELAAVHQAQAAEWQNAASGVVSSVDPAAQKIVFNERNPQGPPQTVTVSVSPQTEFTRYSPQNPNAPAASQLSDIHPGDQLRVIGDKSPDGATITARRVYSGAFRTLNGTIASIAADGSQIVINNLATRSPVTVALTANSEIQNIPPQMVQMMAQMRAQRAAGANGGAGANSNAPANPPPSSGPPPSQAGPSGYARGPRSGDLSRLIERLPKISIAELKPGQAVVVAGALDSTAPDRLVATHVISGVEPLLQAAGSSRQRGGNGGDSLGGDWGLGEMSVPQ